ncbi:MAG TPA: A/G-specific adenine glycosylase, partial [Planctomycetia bacterium]|nr:A/G-specific adenine glycosylase [Planctomycetia bacterium]
MRPAEWFAATDRTAFRRAVRRWYAERGRDLPWRRLPRDPYAVWVAEIMLQQTTVATVIGYFDRFLSRFPTVGALAAAPESDVLHLWQGLGYYRRARMLHQAAQRIVAEHGGEFPRDRDAIAALPGLGRYTAAAVATFAFDIRAGILEANTIRLWTRLAAAAGDPARQPLREELWSLAEEAPPRSSPGDFNQALMDLGAVVCAPAPRCGECPLTSFCAGFREGKPERYPQPAPKRAKEEQEHASTIVHWRDRLLVVRRPDGGRWAGLWEFPRVEKTSDESWEEAAGRAVRAFVDRPFALRGRRLALTHGIMHYKVRLCAYDADLLAAPASGEDSAMRWLRREELESLPFSSPQR